MNKKMETAYDKVIVIGLDGADWRLLKPWIEQGYLPTLARLVAEGASGPLRSTIRPESSVAWSSFATGVNPGQHGIFGFVNHEPNSYRFKLANSSSIRVPRFWDILSKAGRRVGLLNIPFTYPPVPVNGFLVGGMLTPSTDSQFTYPAELQARLLQHFDNYLLDAGDRAHEKEALIAGVQAYTQQQIETIRLLWQVDDFDMLGVVFTGPDRLQHFLWEDIDSQHPDHNEASRQKFGSALREHFALLDQAIAEIIAQVPERTLVLVMSDHGFNGCARRFYVNRWLHQQGLLILREQKNWRTAVVNRLSGLKSIPWFRRLKRAFLPDDWGITNLKAIISSQMIDWSKTRVYYSPDGGLRLNVRGREPQGIISPGKEYEQLREDLSIALTDLRELQTNRSPLAGVYLREELYNGRFLDDAPDLIIEPKRDDPQAVSNFVLDSTVDMGGPVFTSSTPYSGNHALDGILIAWGPSIASGQQIQNARITDLAPTILAALGVAAPSYLDGRTLDQMFLPGFEPASIEDTSSVLEPPDRIDESTNSEEDANVIADRLRNLGYLD
ncbi:MAG: alkaline phosphatase family protein [Candidatus Promineifilaceae bacterium]